MVESNPEAYAKQINPISTPLVVHLCDYEGKSAEDEKQFLHALDKLSAANKARRGGFRYELGYSNLTFELWMILHKSDCNGSHSDKRQYLDLLNKAYGTNFESLAKYKEEANFQKCLKQLTMDDVRTAISRAKKIMNNNRINGARQRQYKGFRFYEDNPSLTIWESIERILKDCGLQ